MFKSLFNWIAEPLSGYSGMVDKPTPSITVHSIPRDTVFRPTRFAEYIGQTKAKDILLNTYMKAVRERSITMPHVLLYGSAGCGKTTLARIIANELGVSFREIVTSTIKDTEEILSIIDYVDGGVVFVDEVHGIPRELAESIYTIMEDFKYNGVLIKPFTLIGATTELGELIQTRKPFVDRFKICLELSDYTIDELTVLLKQYRYIRFPNDILPVEVYITIAENCRKTPRIGISLLEACVYSKGDIQRALTNSNIIIGGYTIKDLEILKYLSDAPVNSKGIRTGIGLLGIASYLGTSVTNYTQVLEPYLLRNNLITRTPRGRCLSIAGEIKIKELELALNVK